MSDKKLKPCPFCGENRKVVLMIEKSSDGLWRIRCDNCGCRTQWMDNEKQAIRAWNTRTPNKTDGWDVWGNEVESDIALAAQGKGE